MRVTTVFRKLLGVTKLFVENVDFEVAGLVLHTRPTWRAPRCSGCQKRAPGYDRKPARRWRHGVDEFSYRKRHRYVTIVVDHDRRRVIWAGEGRSAETLKGFFGELGADCCSGIKEVTIDMAGGYIKAITV